MYYYYCHDSEKLFYTKYNTCCVYSISKDFESLCKEWWMRDRAWVDNFGKSYQDIGYEYKYLNLRPGKQCKLWWLDFQLLIPYSDLDIDRSFFLLQSKIEEKINAYKV